MLNPPSPFESITDLYLPVENPRAGHTFPGKKPLTAEMYAGALNLVEMAKRKRLEDCTLSEGGVAFRCTYFPSADGEYYFYRKMPSKILTMKELGMPREIADHLLSDRMNKGGLIIVSGNPGNGKSTTLASIIVERLIKFAGVCITIEDPIEMPLQGEHGNGICFQRPVSGEEEFAHAIRGALRGYPAKTNGMMMIGEVRDEETAALALRSAVDGRLVMITMHAGTIVQSLQRLCAMAARSSSEDEARELLASSFRMALHQSLISAPGSSEARLVVSALLDTQAVAGTLRSKNLQLDTLKNDFLQQRKKFQLKMPIELRKLD